MDESAARLLLDWYDLHKRDLPWRRACDPYATWVSETMLQQTRVETVLSYYERFLQAFPDVSALAAASEEQVLKLWEGLGYYRRAKNLRRGAIQVVQTMGGVLPRDVSALKGISGIGAYTAGAIASIAYGVRTPAVDGNAIRVTCRLAGIRDNAGAPSVKRRITATAAAMVPAERPGDFNQALMDLGATVCVPGTPDCAVCPLAGLCDARAAGDAEELPVLPQKTPPREQAWDVCLILSEAGVLMRQRTESLLEGMWVFPLLEGHCAPGRLAAKVRRELGIAVTDVAEAGDARHVFTHRVWQMRLYTMRASAPAPNGYRYVPIPTLSALPIPTAMRRARAVLDQNA